MTKILEKLQAYRYKKKLSNLIFSRILNLRHETIMLVIESVREDTILPIKEIKSNARLIDKYTLKHRGIEGLKLGLSGINKNKPLNT